MENNVNASIENLKNELNDVKSKLSEYRKKGFDTKIADLKMMNLPFKIRLAEATQSYKDIEKVNYMIKSVYEELEDIKNQQVQDIDKDAKKKVEQFKSFVEKKESGEVYKEYSHSEFMEETEKLINDAISSINNGDYYKALHNYLDIRDIYQYLPKELKKPVYYKVLEIYRKILNSGIIKTGNASADAGKAKTNVFKKLFGFWKS